MKSPCSGETQKYRQPPILLTLYFTVEMDTLFSWSRMAERQPCPFTVKTPCGIPGSAGASPAIHQLFMLGEGETDHACL